MCGVVEVVYGPSASKRLPELFMKRGDWIIEISVEDYEISDDRRIQGYLGGSYWVNAFILNSKKSIFDAEPRDSRRCFESVKCRMMYDHERVNFVKKKNQCF